MTAKDCFEPQPRTRLRIADSDALFPVHRVYCVGRNYAAHAREMGHSDREPPFFFSKPADACTQQAEVRYPPATSDLHHEVELVVALGRGGRDISPRDAPGCIFGYAVGVDFTRRDLQAVAKQKGRPWDVAKGFDESAPLSLIRPARVTGHPHDSNISLAVNGQTRQSGSLLDMIWPVADVIAGLSQLFELHAGDLIFTGTPDGVGPADVGDIISCSIEGVGDHTFTLVED